MDIQSKVAERRAEIARQTKEAAEQDRERKAAEQRRAREQRRTALDGLAIELSMVSTPVRRENQALALAEESPLQALDSTDFRKNALDGLLTKEARQRFTPGENWYVIAPIAAGVALLLCIPLLGVILIGIGIAVRYRTLDRYRKALTSEFPKLFGSFHRATS